MKKLALLLCLVLLLMNVAVAEGVSGGVTVEANPESATGYTVKFEYANGEATQVRLAGHFNFFNADDPLFKGIGYIRTEDHPALETLVSPVDWKKDAQMYHFGTPNYTVDMEKSAETGLWTCSLDLPCGPYLYSYLVSTDGGKTFETIADPANVPLVNTLGASKETSKVFVPYDDQKQSSEVDYSWAAPMEDASKRGEVVKVTYTGVDTKEHEAMIYLPAGYDANREEPYKVLYLVPGGGGTYADWIHEENAANIVDHYIADGACEPFVFVCTANNEFDRVNTNDPYNLTELSLNIKYYMMPYTEEHYNVSKEASGRAVAGLSYGARVSSLLWINNPELFSYFGVFSASAAFMWQDQNSKMEDLKVPTLFLGGGFADHLTNGPTYQTKMENTVFGMRDLLDQNGFTYNGGNGIFYMQGGHDEFTFQSEFNEFVKTTLWK